jgi:hypothetical protein
MLKQIEKKIENKTYETNQIKFDALKLKSGHLLAEII